MHETLPRNAPVDRQERIRRVVEDVLARRAAGEALADEAVCQEHAGLMPELAAELRKLSIIASGRALAEAEQREAATSETAAFVPTRGAGRRLSRSLRIRCPLCHEPLEIATDQALDDIQCSACRGRFSLAGDDPDLKEQQSVTRIGHFELIQRLGMGGFGTVWKALDTQLDRTVALKIPRRGRLSAAEVEEFLYEARVAAKLRHPHIVIVHEIGRDGDDVYIASDLVEGMSLDKYKDARRLTHREAAELLAKICDALDFAHQAGVVHRDLKPGNILIDASGQPHITDFGLAKRGHGEVEITTEGEIVGTPAYMSPEQARGESHLADRRTDVYALGVILFELLTDNLPFRGNVMMLAHHAVHTEPPSPRRLNATVPADLETICLKCLQKPPDKRYASAKDLADELRRLLAGDPILARPITSFERLWRWAKKNPRVPALSAALLAVVLAAYGVAWAWFNRIYAEADGTLTAQALANVAFTAESVASAAGRDLERYFDAVEQAAVDEALIRPLVEWPQDAELVKLSAALSDPARQNREDDETKALRLQLEEHPRCGEVQRWIDEMRDDLKVFSWFVLLPDGLQIARNPVVTEEAKKTIGRNNAWRAYYNGGPEDQPETWRATSAAERISATHMSPPFVSQFTDEWVISITTPIVGDEKQCLGIVGVMLKLGDFAKLPSTVSANERAEAATASFAVMFDSRPPNEGQILQHPVYGEAAIRRKMLDRSHESALRVSLVSDEALARYRDPLAGVDPRYDHRWLAAPRPVDARGRQTGLSILVQESYDDLIGEPLANLRSGLVWLSLATLVLSAAIVVPLWIVILRLVR